MRLTVRHALLPLALLQIAMPTLPGWVDWASPIGGNGVAGPLRAPESPPGVFFAIWGVIFPAYLLFALIAWREDTTLTRRLAVPLAVTGVFGALWMLVEQIYPLSVINYPVLLCLAAAAFWSAARFDQMRGLGGSPQKFIADLCTGLYAGWMTAATAIATTSLVRAVMGLGETDAVWPMLMLALVVAGGLALIAFHRISRSPWYVAALAWALTGIVINNWFLVGQHVPAVATAVFGFFLLRHRFRLDPHAMGRVS